MEKPNTFGARLREAMSAKKMTMPQLGKGLKTRKNGVLEGDLGRAAVFGWINGTGFPNVVQLAAICQKLDISADQLLFGDITHSGQKVVAPEAMLSNIGAEVSHLRKMVVDLSAAYVQQEGKPLSVRQRLLSGMPQHLGPPIQEEFDDGQSTSVQGKKGK